MEFNINDEREEGLPFKITVSLEPKVDCEFEFKFWIQEDDEKFNDLVKIIESLQEIFKGQLTEKFKL